MTRGAETSSPAVRTVDVIRVGTEGTSSDRVAVESPLEVRVNGESLAVIMRTPGDDSRLALGFLFSEGLVRRRDDVTRIDVDDSTGVVNVVFARGRAEAVAEALLSRRQITTTSSCGMCGRRNLGSLEIEAAPLQAEWRLDQRTIATLPSALSRAQPVFSETGGLHAAALFDLEGRLVSSAEDVGRHNTVDKLIGAMLDDGGLPLTRSLLLVSGRASFEIVQKAWLAGVPLVASVSAPSSLAVDLASRAGITLLGFVRDSRFNVYTHPARVTLPGD